jgi:hypothetical protein
VAALCAAAMLPLQRAGYSGWSWLILLLWCTMYDSMSAGIAVCWLDYAA